MPMSINGADFGTINAERVFLWVMENKNGMVAKISTYGAILTELHVPDRNGLMADVVLGFETINGYTKGHPYFGAMVGRVANRIAKGKFSLGGKSYQLTTNDAPNHLHGGDNGFDKKVWNAKATMKIGGPALELTYVSPDGEEGYPGTLKLTVIYQLTDANELNIQMTATTDKATPVNIAHHSYWNLAGHDSGNILDHELQINATDYTPTDHTLVPTGVIAPVVYTPFDFRISKTIGKDIGELSGDPATGDPGGYDANFVLTGKSGAPAARVHEPSSGRVLELWTTEPGVQFYSGNFLDGTNVGKGEAVYKKHAGFCLETQKYPDAINKPHWPTVVLQPSETYLHEMSHRFLVNE